MDDFQHLAGTVLPEGSLTITHADERTLSALVGARQLAGPAVHPVWLLVALVNGLGVPIADVYAMAGCRMEDGPMLGECELSIDRPLEAGTYRVLGDILDIERKTGGSGTFDVMRMRIRLANDSGVAATCVALQIVPRSRA
jgi:hypothetical protein